MAPTNLKPLTTPILLPEINGQLPAKRLIILAGAGGTGARVAQALPKLLAPGDAIAVVDPDIVEERNLLRQHFTYEDVGKHKAEVVALRVQAALPPAFQESIKVFSIPTRLEAISLNTLWTAMYELLGGRDRAIYTICLGCVDRASARRALHDQSANLFRGTSRIWIDAGNGVRTGQVILSFSSMGVKFPMQILTHRDDYGRATTTNHNDYKFATASFDGVARYAPELLIDDPDDVEQAEGCALRLDTQSVSANQMAATLVISMLSTILSGGAVDHPHVQFSTDPLMVKGELFPTASRHTMARYGVPWVPLPLPGEPTRKEEEEA